MFAGTNVQRSQTPTSVGNSRVPTPTSAASNDGTRPSASSSVSRAVAGGGSDSEGAFFREEEKGRGISPTRSTVKGKLQVKQCPVCLFACLPPSVLLAFSTLLLKCSTCTCYRFYTIFNSNCREFLLGWKLK